MDFLVTATTIQTVSRVLRISLTLSRALAYSAYVITLIGSVLLAIGVIGWPIALATFWEDITTMAQTPWIRMVATVICLLLGLVLFFARTFMPAVYGVAEIVLGVAACWTGLGDPSADRVAGTLALAGGLYVIVRGIDNYKRSKQPKSGHGNEVQKSPNAVLNAGP